MSGFLLNGMYFDIEWCLQKTFGLEYQYCYIDALVMEDEGKGKDRKKQE